MKHFFKIIVTILCFCTFGFSGQPAEAGMISEKQEIEMGKATARQIEARYGVLNDPQITDRVNRIGQSLVDVCGRKNLTYTFKVLNTEDVNALACPGGFIYVFKGLVDYMPSDAELAGVLGHEIGHVVKRHTVHQLEKNMWTQLAAILAGVASGNGDVLAMGMVVGDALAAGYSRADESAADREGFAYTVKAGYSPYAMLVTMHKLQELAAEYGNPGWGIFEISPCTGRSCWQAPCTRSGKKIKLSRLILLCLSRTIRPRFIMKTFSCTQFISRTRPALPGLAPVRQIVWNGSGNGLKK